jgi:subtilisin family serine protease/fibronectin type 3 domain-containing protein
MQLAGQGIPPKPASAGVEIRPDKILVRLKAGLPPAVLAQLNGTLGAAIERTFSRFGNLLLLRLPVNLPVARALELYRNSGLVAYAEPDYVYKADQTRTTPNDLNTLLWGLNNDGQNAGTPDADIDAPEAWTLRTDASTIVVGVVDTGIDYTHPDLAGNMWRNPRETPGNGIDDDGNGYVDDVHGINAVSGAANPGNPMDDQATTYHGTHVAGTIGATGNNGTGVTGVAWRVQLMALKFLNSTGSGSSSDAIKCIDYAIANGAHVLNNSWGGGGYSTALRDAIDRARAAGILFVASAGNDAVDTDRSPAYPAGYVLPNVVSVASSDRLDRLSSFSNYGYKTVHLAAPGSSIYSTMAGARYQSLSGTSMASPHVSGALAMLKAQYPSATATELVERLLLATDPVNALSAASLSGGRLNLYRALSGLARVIPHFGVNATSGEPGALFTFTDSSLGQITARTLDFGDGSSPVLFQGTATHSYSAPGEYVVTLTATGPDGTATRSLRVTIQSNYTVSSTPYRWTDTTGFATIGLADDAASALVTLPFSFPYYGASYGSLAISSNGFVTLGGNVGATAYQNAALPNPGMPNGGIYPFWDDLNPAALTTAAIRHGLASDGKYVVSWEGVPPYGANTSPLDFQLTLAPGGEISFQYRQVQPQNTMAGAGRSATVGIEAASGLIARQYSHNGSTLLANSTALTFVPNRNTAPAAPSALQVGLNGAGAAALSWRDNSSDEDGFRIDRRQEATSFQEMARVAGGTTSYTDTTVADGQTYIYRVVAYNAAGDSGGSNEASIVVTRPPAAPANLTAVASSSSQMNLTWADASSNEAGFRVYRSVNAGAFTQVASLPAGTTSYTDSGLQPGTAYGYRITAFNDVGESNPAAITVTTPGSVPATPGSLIATAVSASQVNLSWADAANNETGYRVYRSTAGSAYTLLATLAANATIYSNTGLIAGTSYAYRVTAFNASGESAAAAVSVTTRPAAPTSLRASGASQTTMLLTWTHNSAGVTSFVIERLSGTAYVAVGTAPTGSTRWTDSGLTRNTRYTYRVKATGPGGDSAYSATASASTRR